MEETAQYDSIEDTIITVTAELAKVFESPDTFILVLGPSAFFLLAFLIVLIARFFRKRAELKNIKAQQQLDDFKLKQVSSKLPDRITDLDKSSIEQPKPKTPVAPSWRDKLYSGLSKTRDQFSSKISGLFGTNQKLSEETLEKLHEILYRADVGVKTANRLIESLQKNLSKEEAVDQNQVFTALKQEITLIFEESDKALRFPETSPKTLLVVGVNGVGKTTSVAKIANQLQNQGQKVLLAAADTFRAAAIDQLKVWAERLNVDIIAKDPGTDPASVAFDSCKAAISRNADYLIVDTAGRLHNKKELMDELGKISRVMQKDVEGAPHETWLVVDATTGQNAIMQIKAFSEVVPLTGLVVTKLDGTAKGGVIIAAADQFKIPIRFIGVGEKAEDLQPFRAEEFCESLFS